MATPWKHFTVRRVSFGLQHCRKFFRIFGIDTDQQYSRAWTWWWTEYRNQGILVHVLSDFFGLKDGSRVRSPLFDSKTFHWDHDPMNYDDQCFFLQYTRQPRFQGPLSSSLEKVPWLRLIANRGRAFAKHFFYANLVYLNKCIFSNDWLTFKSRTTFLTIFS